MKKANIADHLGALEKYNQWEKRTSIGPSLEKRILMVCDLYDLIPYNSRQRAIDIQGIVRMRRALASLTTRSKQ